MNPYLLFLLGAGMLACTPVEKPGRQGDISATSQDIPLRPREEGWPARFGIGRVAEASFIEKWDISIAPDGKGLPSGKGQAWEGEKIYQAKCVLCHGTSDVKGPYDVLIQGEKGKGKTIGNYWPYATTIFDYVRRAMPYNAPGSLSNQEVYHLTAFLLYANGIIPREKEIDAKTLPLVKMPARDLFVPDDRRGGAEIR